jgi:tetratricopeptide (TPR) repeat protein
VPDFASVADGLAWIDTEGANVLATIRYAESSGALEHAWRTGLAVAPCFFQRGRADELDEALELALRAAVRDSDAEAESRVLLSTGSLGRYRVGAEESLRTLQEARDKLPENADLTLRARLLASIGYSQARLRPDEEALAVLDDALDASRQAGDRSITARVLAYLGVAYSDRLEFAQALTSYQESLAQGDPGVQPEVLNGIGECLLELDRMDEAITALTTARDLGIERGADYSLIYTYSFLGTAYARQRQWIEAIDIGRQAVELAQDSDSSQSQQNAYVRLAETLLAKGDLIRARPADSLGPARLPECDWLVRCGKYVGCWPSDCCASRPAATHHPHRRAHHRQLVHAPPPPHPLRLQMVIYRGAGGRSSRSTNWSGTSVCRDRLRSGPWTRTSRRRQPSWRRWRRPTRTAGRRSR